MNTRILHRLIILMLSAVLVVACNKDISEIDNISGKPLHVDLNFNLLAEQQTYLGEATPNTYSIANPGNPGAGGTDEGTSIGYKPQDIWVIQFNGTNDASAIVGSPQYYLNLADVELATSTVANTFVFVANTHNASLSWGTINTLADIKNIYKTITAETDCYGNNSSTNKDLVMSGFFQGIISESTTNITINLYRNISRIDFSLSNAIGSTMTLLSVQLCNVPKRFYWATSLIGVSTLWPVSTLATDYMDYPVETLSGAMNPGGNQTITWYMPFNQKGVVNSATITTKPDLAPDNATYIRIEAKNAQNKLYVYTIYLGENLTNDYNLSANHKYNIELSVNASGVVSDGRVETPDRVYLGDANSYILNPAQTGNPDRIFFFPIDRLNRFWAGRTPDLSLGEDDTWTAELLWQDTPTSDFIRFVDPAEEPYTDRSLTQSGVGPNQRIVVATKAGYEGNALVCLKNSDGQILWSWHLWVTNYNPDYTDAPVSGKYVYPVTGGVVHRYAGNSWTSGRYANKYIMDRNLGALNSHPTSLTNTTQFVYEFGRKDPFPKAFNYNGLYDIQGAPVDMLTDFLPLPHVEGGWPYERSVLNPTNYLTRYAEDYDGDVPISNWCNTDDIDGSVWKNTVAGTELKSLFDPCPPGWKVPLYDVWEDFVLDPSDLANSTVCNGDMQVDWDYNGKSGLRYRPLGSSIDPVFYPAWGNRPSFSPSSFIDSQNSFAVWASNFIVCDEDGRDECGYKFSAQTITSSPYCLLRGGVLMGDLGDYARQANAAAVRCVQE